jgi:ubiquinone biosynthesis protein COQ4
MPADPPPILQRKRDWRAAIVALRKLLAEGGDTVQVFRIMRALNVGIPRRNYLRLIETVEGGRIAYDRVELVSRLSDLGVIEGFAEGTVGAAYRDFLNASGFSGEGLAEISRADSLDREARHPYAWMARRVRDTHDIWHVLTGYRADEPFGEACLVAFSYAQVGGLGWAAIGVGGMVKALRQPEGRTLARAIREGYRRGRRAAWLIGEDYEALLAEPLVSARIRLKIADAPLYLQAEMLRAAHGHADIPDLSAAGVAGAA